MPFTNRIKRHVLRMTLKAFPPEHGRDCWDFFHASGDAICPVCLEAYRLHPEDPEDPFLFLLCNGWRVKL